MVQWNEDSKNLMLYIELSCEGMSLLNNIADTLDIEDFIIMRLLLLFTKQLDVFV